MSGEFEIDWGKKPRTAEEERFLEGPKSRLYELFWAIRIFWEFIRGLRRLHFIGPCVTVFGSARFKEGSTFYELGLETGRKLGLAGYSVMTGGGPGLMEAANRGAKEVNAFTVGCNIELPVEQAPNPYLDLWITFRYFFVRKIMLTKYSLAFIALPGGFGTLDEVFQTATLVQTGKIKNFPLVFVGVDYWTPLFEFIKNQLAYHGAIDPADMNRLFLTDSPEEAVKFIQNATSPTRQKREEKKLRIKWYLWEK